MAKVLLGVTGSVAAIHTPLLVAELRGAGHEVKVVATRASLYFFNPLEIAAKAGQRDAAVVILEEDEWPGSQYRRGDPVLHIELRRWGDLFLIAPLDANTLAKLAYGLADNCLTCVWRAWDRARPVVLAPAMNTLMWESPLTVRHFRLLGELSATKEPPANLGLEELMSWINMHCPLLRVVPPISKRLACDDVGVGVLAERGEIVAAVEQLMRSDRTPS